MIKKLLYGIVLVAGLVSCDDDYTDWSNPQSNAAKDAVEKFEMLVQPGVTSINFATEAATEVQFFTTNLEEGQTKEYNVVFSADDKEATAELTVQPNGMVSVADLEKAVTSVYGRAPQERTLNVNVSAEVAITTGDGVVVAKKSGAPFVFKGTPNAPQISDAYYIIGEPGAWDPSDITLKFNHSGNDVYDDPVFTITIPVADNDGDGNMWFAISDAIAAEAYSTSGGTDWSKVIGCAEGNGNNADEGKVARRSEIGNDGSFVIPVDGTAKFVKITLNMMDYSYKIEKLNFQENLWIAGSGNGWAHVDMVSSLNYDGEYVGFMNLGNVFKFCSQPNWDGTNYGEGFSTDPGAGDMTLPAGYAEGYYMVNMSLTSNTLNLTPITTIGVIGDATPNGWDASTPLTYNPANRCWEADVVLTDGEFKFRANDGWDISWGGDLNNLSIDNAPNITVAAGAYHIALYPNCPGKAYAELTAN